MPSKIKESAILKDGKIFTGHRHHNIINSTDELGLPFGYFKGGIQGFVDEDGNFLTREEAVKVAIDLGQVKEENLHVSGKLFSEDLY